MTLYKVAKEYNMRSTPKAKRAGRTYNSPVTVNFSRDAQTRFDAFVAKWHPGSSRSQVVRAAIESYMSAHDEGLEE